MNKILFEVSWIGNIFGLLGYTFNYTMSTMCWLYMLIKQRDKIDQSKLKGKIRYKIYTIIGILWGIFNLALGFGLKKGYNEVVLAYKLGNYCEIEGEVENFRPSNGRYDECFSIGDVDFRYGLAESWGYCQTMKWSVIEGDGQQLKIRYVTIRGDYNVIVYIEQLEE